MAATPGMAAPAGAPVPGGSAPLRLPDLQAVGRAAMASVVEGNAAQVAARERLPDLIEVATQARIGAQAAGAAPAGAAASTTAPADVRLLAPAQTRAVPGVWRAPPPPPPPPPGWAPQPQVPRPPGRTAWSQLPHGPRDAAQRFGDRLYPLVERIRESRAGWVGVVALFGITVPIILLRKGFDVRARVALSLFIAIFWFQLVSELFGG